MGLGLVRICQRIHKFFSFLGCPEGWAVSSTNSNKCYNIFHFSPLSQTDAQRNCEQYFGSLLSIDNAFENAAITGINRFLPQLFSSLGYIKSNAPTCTTSYIGLMRHGPTWKWINGDNSTYLNWEAGMALMKNSYETYLR
jgi:hypothetical protein